jgi:hypothetical protein
MADTDPITKKDLLDLENRLRDSTAETVRDAQTEILRGFVAFQNSNGPRMRKMEADLSNIDTRNLSAVGGPSACSKWKRS